MDQQYDFSHLKIGDTETFQAETKGLQSPPALAARKFAKMHPEYGFSIGLRRDVVSITRVKVLKPRRHVKNKYHFAKIEIGQSAFFEHEPKGGKSRPAIAARVFSNSNPDYQFSARAEDGGVRIWRIGPGFERVPSKKPPPDPNKKTRRKKYRWAEMDIGHRVFYSRHGGHACLALGSLAKFCEDNPKTKFKIGHVDWFTEIERIA